MKTLYGDVAKLDELPVYLERAQEQAGDGREIVLTGQKIVLTSQEIILTGEAPIWIYLTVAHALHVKVRRLWYQSPATGELLIFDHSAR